MKDIREPVFEGSNVRRMGLVYELQVHGLGPGRERHWFLVKVSSEADPSREEGRGVGVGLLSR